MNNSMPSIIELSSNLVVCEDPNCRGTASMANGHALSNKYVTDGLNGWVGGPISVLVILIVLQ